MLNLTLGRRAVAAVGLLAFVAAGPGCRKNVPPGATCAEAGTAALASAAVVKHAVPPGTALFKILAFHAGKGMPLRGSFTKTEGEWGSWGPRVASTNEFTLEEIVMNGDGFVAVLRKRAPAGGDEQLEVTGRVSGETLTLGGGRVVAGPKKGQQLALSAEFHFEPRFVLSGDTTSWARGTIQLDGEKYAEASIDAEFARGTDDWRSFGRQLAVLIGPDVSDALAKQTQPREAESVVITGLEDLPSDAAVTVCRGYWCNPKSRAIFSVLVRFSGLFGGTTAPQTVEVYGGTWCVKPRGISLGSPGSFHATGAIDPKAPGRYLGTYHWGIAGSGQLVAAATFAPQALARTLAAAADPKNTAGAPGGMLRKSEAEAPKGFYELHDIQLRGDGFDAVLLWRHSNGETERLKVAGEVHGDRLTLVGGEVLDGPRRGRDIRLRADLLDDGNVVTGRMELDGFVYRHVTFTEGWSETYRSQQPPSGG